MRKSFVLLISVVLLFGISFASLAGDINIEAVLVQEPPVVYTGSSLAITVKAEAMGGYHAQSWHFSNNLWETNGGSIDHNSAPWIEDNFYYKTALLIAPQEPGTYTLSVVFSMKAGNDAGYYYARASKSIVVLSRPEAFPSATSVATKLLKEAGIKAHYDGGNHVSDVAGTMAADGSFLGVAKDSPDYARVIWDFMFPD